MQRVSSGYTIVEVIIFLAVSAGLLVAAFNLISGRQQEVQFDQSTRDIQSKIEDWANDVSTGFPGGDANQLKCSAPGVGSRPIISPGGPSPSPDCIFIGKAIQFRTDSGYADKVYAYSIFGHRLNGSGQLVSNIIDAKSAAATNLTEEYSLGAAEVKSVTSAAIIPTTPITQSTFTSSHLIGFFSSFNTEQNSRQNGSLDVNAYQFQFDGSSPNPSGPDIRNCLELNGNPCKKPNSVPDDSQWPERLQSLKVCLTDEHRTALLTISSTDGFGVSTKLDYVDC